MLLVTVLPFILEAITVFLAYLTDMYFATRKPFLCLLKTILQSSHFIRLLVVPGALLLCNEEIRFNNQIKL
jgi:hypothetical protein